MNLRNQRATPNTPVTVSEAHRSPTDVRRILYGTPVFRDLPAEELSSVVAVFRQRHDATGEPIYHCPAGTWPI